MKLLAYGALKCGNPACIGTMLGPLKVKVFEAHVPHLPNLNDAYWKYDREKNELEGFGYFCPRCGSSRIIHLPVVDEQTGMVTWE